MPADPLVSLIAARYALGHVAASEMVDFAERLLARGVETPELLMLSLPSEATPETFERTMGELGQVIPTKNEALRLVATAIAELVTIGKRDALVALADFRDLRNETCDVANGRHVCPSDLDELANLYWVLDDLHEPAGSPELRLRYEGNMQSLRCEVVRRCQAMVESAPR